MNYVTLAVPFFILLMFVEALYGRLLNKQTYRLNDTINSLQMGTLSSLKNILRLSFAALVFTSLVSFFGIQTLPTDNPWIWILSFIAYDFCYYWKHRYGHQWRIMWASHAAHHQSEEYNLSTALRQTGTDYIGFVFYLPIYLAGVPLEVIISVGSLNLIYQFWVHTEHIRRLGPLELMMVTPSNHRVHHARNPQYIDKNYGGVFILWDRIFGTFKDEDSEQPCVYGITKGLKSWNPIWANFHVWSETAQLSLRTSSWKDKIKVWFKGPGWYPEDVKPTTSEKWQYPKFDPQVSAYVKYYAFLQFIALLALSLFLTGKQVDLPREIMLFSFFWVCFSFYTQGLWLEGKGFAEVLDWVRLIILTNAVVAMSIFWPEISINYFLSAGGYCFVTVLGLFVLRYKEKAPIAAVERSALP